MKGTKATNACAPIVTNPFYHLVFVEGVASEIQVY